MHAVYCVYSKPLAYTCVDNQNQKYLIIFDRLLPQLTDSPRDSIQIANWKPQLAGPWFHWILNVILLRTTIHIPQLINHNCNNNAIRITRCTNSGNWISRGNWKLFHIKNTLRFTTIDINMIMRTCVTPASRQKCAIFGYIFKSKVIFDKTNAALRFLAGCSRWEILLLFL
jgi:hypothetical protein